MTKKVEVYPCSIATTEADQKIAQEILAKDSNYVVRYLRNYPTVGLAKIPVRNQDGAIMEDLPAVRKRVICAGVPFACIIAFVHREELLIGWSKRIDTRQLVETQDLHELFRNVLEDTKGVRENSEDYQVTFNIFAKKMVNFLACQQPKETEISFSKTGGKAAAIIRGLYDTVSFDGNFVTSAASGPVPNDIAKNLPWFIDYAEKIYAGKAANVGYPMVENKDVAVRASTAIAAI